MYVARRERWKAIFKFGQGQAKRLDLREDDVAAAVATVRRARKRR